MAAPAKKDADAKAEAQQQEEQAPDSPAQGGGRVRGIDALSPTDRQSAEQTDPRVFGKGGLQRGPSSAADVPESQRTGSVLPYKIDNIDVDSFDSRTTQEIQAQREKDAKK